jgi:hypothetical protein
MALTTRVISWSVEGVDNSQASGSITIKPSVPVIVDTVGGVVYEQNTLTYSLAVGQSAAVITTDNAGTNPPAGSWGYDITVQLAPGVPSVSVQDVLVPAGGGSYSLATILNAAGL